MSQDFRFRLDPRSGVPIYRQIIDQVTGGIAAGTLREGIQLPTVRQLAVDLSINPNTVIRAYSELEIRGVLNTEQGTGTFIGAAASAAGAVWTGSGCGCVSSGRGSVDSGVVAWGGFGRNGSSGF